MEGLFKRQNQRRQRQQENIATNERFKRGETVTVTFGGPTIAPAEDDLDLALAALDECRRVIDSNMKPGDVFVNRPTQKWMERAHFLAELDALLGER